MKIQIYDCGCVESRPKKASCKSYGTRWRVYMTPKHIILKCRDCKRSQSFEIKQNVSQKTDYEWSR